VVLFAWVMNGETNAAPATLGFECGERGSILMQSIAMATNRGLVLVDGPTSCGQLLEQRRVGDSGHDRQFATASCAINRPKRSAADDASGSSMAAHSSNTPAGVPFLNSSSWLLWRTATGTSNCIEKLSP
jgi:hypothetical protein